MLRPDMLSVLLPVHMIGMQKTWSQDVARMMCIRGFAHYVAGSYVACVQPKVQ